MEWRKQIAAVHSAPAIRLLNDVLEAVHVGSGQSERRVVLDGG